MSDSWRSVPLRTAVSYAHRAAFAPPPRLAARQHASTEADPLPFALNAICGTHDIHVVRAPLSASELHPYLLIDRRSCRSHSRVSPRLFAMYPTWATLPRRTTHAEASISCIHPPVPFLIRYTALANVRPALYHSRPSFDALSVPSLFTPLPSFRYWAALTLTSQRRTHIPPP
ncbi:hypothetical protein HYPSUDRAFT_198751 [Hypholoma sublateritium FD-334 SS-4]|uniref:Uncharacterized protein n=1 Tax=Hypholoma sublateritium (strain FD-334 SS-4) TaxID=945553 RepID=A0A0D2LFM0_HYPSF|nr:hypothetical protein HYPSUDRAFT_198751 [Hypholoma sublateritium FD-334 SS-4]